MTNAVRHTAGPWIYEVIPSADEDETIHAIIMAQGNLDGETMLAEIMDYTWADYPNANEIAEANARLIAAAPELLEALDEAVNDYNDGVAMRHHTYTLARVAIAKATGA